MRRISTFWVDKYLTFKPEAQQTKRDKEGKDVNPELLPMNVSSKGHWTSAEKAIEESCGVYIDRESLKASGVICVGCALFVVLCFVCWSLTCSC